MPEYASVVEISSVGSSGVDDPVNPESVIEDIAPISMLDSSVTVSVFWLDVMWLLCATVTLIWGTIDEEELLLEDDELLDDDDEDEDDELLLDDDELLLDDDELLDDEEDDDEDEELELLLLEELLLELLEPRFRVQGYKLVVCNVCHIVIRDLLEY